MKKIFLFLMFAISFLSAVAQDVIVKNDGSTVLCKIIGVNNNEVIYTKWSDVNGPQYIIDRTLVSNINYQDGRQDKFNEQSTNAYAPGVQQTGAANYNDNALLAMDNARRGLIPSKINKYKTIAWGVGVPCIVVGVGTLTAGCFFEDAQYAISFITIGTAIAATGIVILPTYLYKAHKLAISNYLTTAPVFQHE
ncbi:MAG: hypothetical protein K2N03_08670, partial [Muribaculaceae bacterium]|nr:hypothetical protein [Muribaculaceae bacterium]